MRIWGGNGETVTMLTARAISSVMIFKGTGEKEGKGRRKKKEKPILLYVSYP